MTNQKSPEEITIELWDKIKVAPASATFRQICDAIQAERKVADELMAKVKKLEAVLRDIAKDELYAYESCLHWKEAKKAIENDGEKLTITKK